MRDRGGQALAYIYFEDEPRRRSAAKLLELDRFGAELGLAHSSVMTDALFWRGPSNSQTNPLASKRITKFR